MLSYFQKRVIFVSNNALKKKKKSFPCCSAGILTEQSHSSFPLCFFVFLKINMFSWRCCLELDKAQAVTGKVFCTVLFMYINFCLFFTI